MFTSTAYLDFAIAVLGLSLVSLCWRSKNPAPLPPGPKPLPLLGNVLDMPSDGKEWITWSKIGERYGDISSLTVFGQTIIILNSVQIAIDMLDKKSSKYSGRPVMRTLFLEPSVHFDIQMGQTLEMGGELSGWKNTLVLLPYGERFRNYRKGIHRIIGTPALMRQFHPIEEVETRKFLRRILAKPDDLAEAIRNAAGAIILKISYGYNVQEHDDPLVKLADTATEQFSSSCRPGAFLVDVLPILKYVPDWFPGAGFKRLAKHWRATVNEMAERPYRMVKDQMAAGTAPTSYTSTLLEDKDRTEEQEHVIKWSSASLYSGGADTTVSAVYAFFCAMALHPEVQEKARAEIDSVCGSDRLPTFTDREDLPYIDALCKEAMRFHVVAPTSIPHRATEDDIHEGYFIPKNALIITNLWRMLHDPRHYPDPSRFNPDRFLGPQPQRDPREICFGFGRRICPGRMLADASIFLACAQTLAVFEIGKVVENGVVTEPVHEQMSGVISHALPFKCSIKPRSERAASLIMADD